MSRTILKALCAVQKDLSEAGIAKTQTNSFDKYKFRGIDDVLNALSPILAKHGVVIMPSVMVSRINPVQTSGGKLQNHATVEVEYTLYDEEGDSISHKFVGEGMDRGDKSINKACTAAFKYFLFECFCIPVQGTPDADQESPELSNERVPPVETPQMVEAGAQLNACLEMDDYLGAAQIYNEWSHEENSVICRAPSNGGELTTANRTKLKSTEFRMALNAARGIETGAAA